MLHIGVYPRDGRSAVSLSFIIQGQGLPYQQKWVSEADLSIQRMRGFCPKGGLLAPYQDEGFLPAGRTACALSG